MRKLMEQTIMTTFEQEIWETPNALRQLLSLWRSKGAQKAMRRSLSAHPVRDVVFTGMGSSVNAAYPAKYLLARQGIPSRIEPASELLYCLLETISPETLVIAVSQSGETIETNKVVCGLQDHSHLWVIANDEGSRMAASGRPFFPIKAGQETRTSSKSFTNTLALLYLLAEQIGRAAEVVSDRQWDSIVETIRSVLSQGQELAGRMLNHWHGLNRLHIVARGPSLACAHQASLILAEATDIFAQAVDGGTFRHGYNLLATEGHKMLAIAAESPTLHLTTRLAEQAARQGSRVAILTSCAEGVTRHMRMDDRVLIVGLPPTPADLAPLSEMVALEILALKLAEERGRDAGKVETKVAQEE